MKEERLWELVALKLAGEASFDELQELSHLIKTHPEFGFKVEFLKQIWEQKEETATIETSFSKHLQRLSNHCTPAPMQYDDEIIADTSLPIKAKYSGKKLFLWLSSIAAILFAVVVMVHQFKRTGFASNLSQNIVTTKPGSKSKITLPDGTQVWLNADSKLTYDENFGDNLREVVLTGEAYFDVVKDKSRPFIIHSKSIDVKVLGTAFNVRSYPDESTSETSLIRGIVEVTLKSNPDKKIILKPNEKLVVQNEATDNSDKEKSVQPVTNTPLLTLSKLRYFKGDSTSVETSWIRNKLAFDEEDFESVAKKIEKWYGVSISIKDNNLKNEAFSGVFDDETLAEVMDALKLTGNFTYTINKREVVIKP